MKLVPDPSQIAAEQEILKESGFTVIEITLCLRSYATRLWNTVGAAW